MKITRLFSLLVPFFLVSLLNADVNKFTQPIDFGGGLNIKTIPSNIADNESPDMSNFVNDRYGASQKRDGAKRYISQPISSSPICSLYRAYVTTGTEIRKSLFATTGHSIWYTTTDVSPTWNLLTSSLTSDNQHFSFTTMNNKVEMSGDKLTDNMWQYDILSSSFQPLISNDTSSTTVNIRCKYIMSAKNYFVGANCSLTDWNTNVSTFFPSRMYYSLILNSSSFSASRFIDFNPDDGDFITGLGFMNKVLNIFKQNTIFQLSFSNLNNVVNGGDQVSEKIVTGFGAISPRTIANTGDYYIFEAKDGIREWDGGGRGRLTVLEESRIISEKISPIIDRINNFGTYKNSSGIFYPTKQWYVWFFEDPDLSPHGKPNSAMIYDLINQDWFPIKNWNAESAITFDEATDFGQFLYGDSLDGYVYTCDNTISKNDARKESVIDTMDSETTWKRGVQDLVNVKEGTASQKMILNTSVSVSSITLMKNLNFNEWYDKSKVSLNDKIAFKAYLSGQQNLSFLRVDLEVSDLDNEFDNVFTSVTITSAAFSGGDNGWSTFEVPLSSFVLNPTWTDLVLEVAPLADTQIFYGIRFVSSGTNVGISSVSIDDLRLVQNGEQPLNAYRTTKQFNFGSPGDKRFRQIFLNRESTLDTLFSIDLFNNFGQITTQKNLNGSFNKDLYLCGYNNLEGLFRLSSVDFSVQDSSTVYSSTVAAFRVAVADDKNLFAVDRYNQRIFKIDKNVLPGAFISTYGAAGTGNDQFDNVMGIAVDDKNIYTADMGNHRIKINKKNNFEFVNTYGTLGKGATSFHLPTSVQVDDRNMWVADDGNHRIVLYGKDISNTSFTYITNVGLALNTFGHTQMAVTERYLYDLFETVSSSSPNYLDLIMEKRDKTSLNLVNKIQVFPQNSTAISSSVVMGNIAISGQFIFIPFTNDENGKGNYYIQKRLLSDMSLVKEYVSKGSHYGIAANGYAYKPNSKIDYIDVGTEGTYLQVRYNETGLDNNLKLLNQTFLYEEEPVQEKH